MPRLNTPRIPMPVSAPPVGREGNGQNRGVKAQQLIEHIEKGSRLAWSYALDCPCEPLHNQTDRANPGCERCGGSALRRIGPGSSYTIPETVGPLDPLQRAIVAQNEAAVIRGVIAQANRTQDLYDTLGNVVRGTMEVTVRDENMLAYYDRLVNLDALVATYQLAVAGAPAMPLRLRYLARQVVAIVSDERRYEQGTDFDIAAGDIIGQVVWRTGRGPVEGTRLGVRYITHPTWLVINQPHVMRQYHVNDSGPAPEGQYGTPRALPLKATVRMEYIPETSGG